MTRLSAFAVLTAVVISVGFSLANGLMSGQVQTAKRGDLKPQQAGRSGWQTEVSRKHVPLQSGKGIQAGEGWQ